VLPVKSECLPFRQIPHSTRLFLDYLCHDSKVQPFYRRSPHFAEWVREESSSLRYDPARREQVAATLERQNRGFGASENTFRNIARLRAGAAAVVTGQQVGLFGGPAFAIFKALTSAKLAAEATAQGIDCVPIFWLATEDHDIAEVSATSLPESDFFPQKIVVPAQAHPDAPVGSIAFGPEIQSAVEQASGLLGPSEITDWLRNSYQPGATFGSAFAGLFARLFAEWGVILLNSADPALHEIARPVFADALRRSAALDQALLARGKQLESAGYHQQVKVTPSSTLLFMIQEGSRVVIRRRPNAAVGEPEYIAGSTRIREAELLAAIESTPQNFSANVLLRPVMQDYLLPTLAYVGGAAEVAYFAQAAVVYESLLGKVTPVLPRFSATLIEPKPQALLEKYHLHLNDLFHGAEPLLEKLADRNLPSEVQAVFEKAQSAIEQSLRDVTEKLRALDISLEEAAERSASKMRYQLYKLRSRAGRAELRRTEILARHATLLSNALFPHKTLQEREIGGVYFLARYGLDLLSELYSSIHPDCVDHQIITL
jgi:bacillithiol biosynthesis cysteine-adding enzyme BshC